MQGGCNDAVSLVGKNWGVGADNDETLILRRLHKLSPVPCPLYTPNGLCLLSAVPSPLPSNVLCLLSATPHSAVITGREFWKQASKEL